MEDEISRLLHHCYMGMLQERQTFRLDIDKEYYYRDVFSRWVDLAYDSIPSLGLSLSVDSVICVREISRYIERKHFGRFRGRTIRI